MSEGSSDFIKYMMIARKSIIETKKEKGSIECPKCKGKLLFSVAINYNGHVHARCTTENCLAWME